MSGKYTCKLCNKDFSTKSNLNRHNQTTKSCKYPEKHFFTCTFCQKNLSSKDMLEYHQNICKEKINKTEVDILKKQVQTMEKEVERLREKPTNIIINDHSTTNNNYGSILNLSKEVVHESFKNYSIEDLMASNSQKTLADMTMKNCLLGPDNPIYYCKDRVRHKFFYKDEENKETEDPNAIILRTMVYNGIKPIIKKLYTEKNIELHNELARCKRIDNSKLIISSKDDIKELEHAYTNVNILKDGEEYIAQLSKCLPSSIKDRIYLDSLELEKSLESDIELQQHIKQQTRMIGDYTVSELNKWKKIYLESGEIKGPKEILTNLKFQKEFIDFLKN